MVIVVHLFKHDTIEGSADLVVYNLNQKKLIIVLINNDNDNTN